MTNGIENQRGFQLLEKIFDRNPLPQNEVDNRFCLVAGNTNNNFIIGPIKGSLFITLLLLMDILYVIAEIINSLGLEKLVEIYYVVDDFLESLWLPVRIIPFEIGGFVIFGSVYYEQEMPPKFTPSNGWIYSLGLRGVQSLNGSFYGTIREFVGEYIGLSGFTGIVLRPWGTGRLLFLGSAYRVGMSLNPP